MAHFWVTIYSLKSLLISNPMHHTISTNKKRILVGFSSCFFVCIHTFLRYNLSQKRLKLRMFIMKLNLRTNLLNVIVSNNLILNACRLLSLHRKS